MKGPTPLTAEQHLKQAREMNDNLCSPYYGKVKINLYTEISY